MGRRRFRRQCRICDQFVKVVKQGLCYTDSKQTVNGRCSSCTFSPPQPAVEDRQLGSPAEITSSDSIFVDVGTNYYQDSFSLPTPREPVKEESLYKNANKFVFYEQAWPNTLTTTIPTLEYASVIFSFNDFYNGRRYIQTLHTGDFGRVGLITVNGQQDKYVLKSFGLRNCDFEVSFLVDSQSQFVTKLHGCVNTSCGRLLFLEHYPLGSLDTLTKYGQTVPEKTAVWTIANLYAATDYIHGLGTLHLDINPTNVLIDHQGYPILSDFGMAQKANEWLDKNNTSFTKAYSCPELRNGCQPYKTADYWSIACCLYELLKGRPPVFGETTQEAIAQIFLDLKKCLTGCSIVAYDFFTMELHPLPRRRLGSRGISAIMMHQIFNELIWKSIKSGCRLTVSPLLKLVTALCNTQSPTNEDQIQTSTTDTNSHLTVDSIKSTEIRSGQKEIQVKKEKTRARKNPSAEGN